jgi:outer membrane protein insertion porin family
VEVSQRSYKGEVL